jgi:hypothetical protein
LSKNLQLIFATSLFAFKKSETKRKKSLKKSLKKAKPKEKKSLKSLRMAVRNFKDYYCSY